MSQVIEAVYENGVFRPEAPVAGLSPGQRVRVTIAEPRDLRQSHRKETDLIRSLQSRGLVEELIAPPAPAGFEPLQMPGPGLSDTILAERR
jgi:predicted DNA-binding antitoxin AbrB/MazE fold protein